MKYDIINTGTYLLIVDDSEIKKGDFCYDEEANPGYNNQKGITKCLRTASDSYWNKHCKKIIAHLPLNNSPILIGVDFLPPLEDEIEELAKKYAKIETNAFYVEEVNKNSHKRSLEQGFISGYNKAKEKYKWTDEDVREALFRVLNTSKEECCVTHTKDSIVRRAIQSLQQPKMPIAFEYEMVNCDNCVYVQGGNLSPDCCNQFKPKTTTNSQGHTEWVGKYVY